MSGGNENKRDPRVRLVREKYFSIRPRPLERWLWAQGIPASAERVFWVHWQEGVQRGDWCSEIPLRRVALECSLDVSTVTRAYQLLGKMGCIRRTDPGRDPANPFQQATAVTEVRLPRELLGELDRHPNRRAAAPREQKSEVGRQLRPDDAPLERDGIESTREAASGAKSATLACAARESSASSEPKREEGAASPIAEEKEDATARDSFAGLNGRERARALTQLTQAMSASERSAYQDAMRLHRTSMAFDMDSKLTEEARAAVVQILASMASGSPTAAEQAPMLPRSVKLRARSLSVFELARLKREIQKASSSTGSSDLLRQVVWSVEAGALRRFEPMHAIHIALKKIREGGWTRPHRMPPNWVREMGVPAVFETCGAA